MKDIMLQNTSNDKGFNSVFSEVQGHGGLKIPNSNCLRLFHLEIKNSKFSYLGLHPFLQKNIGRYVFSRATIENYYLEGEAEAIPLEFQDECARIATDYPIRQTFSGHSFHLGEAQKRLPEKFPHP